MAKRKPLSQQSTDALLKAMLIFARTVDHVLEKRATATVGVRLSKTRIETLRLLGQRGGHTSTQIARFLGVSKPAVTQMVDAMVRSKLLVRKPSRVDRRGVVVALAPKGRVVFRKLQVEQRHLARSAVRQSPRGDADRWVRQLREITGALAPADRAFERFCLQCGAHADGTCVLEGGDANCLFLQHQGDMPSRPKKAARKAGRPRR